ncbi:MAG: hypothetical protein WC707_05830 [Candidatus Babeliaceae bacterium]|jgi:hypothetical protein
MITKKNLIFVYVIAGLMLHNSNTTATAEKIFTKKNIKIADSIFLGTGLLFVVQHSYFARRDKYISPLAGYHHLPFGSVLTLRTVMLALNKFKDAYDLLRQGKLTEEPKKESDLDKAVGIGDAILTSGLLTAFGATLFDYYIDRLDSNDGRKYFELALAIRCLIEAGIIANGINAEATP